MNNDLILQEHLLNDRSYFRVAEIKIAISFQALPATEGRVQAMDAGFGLSTRKYFDGLVICMNVKG